MGVEIAPDVERRRFAGLEAVLPDDRQQQRRDYDAVGMVGIHRAELAVGGAAPQRAGQQGAPARDHLVMVEARDLGKVAGLGDHQLGDARQR